MISLPTAVMAVRGGRSGRKRRSEHVVPTAASSSAPAIAPSPQQVALEKEAGARWRAASEAQRFVIDFQRKARLVSVARDIEESSEDDNEKATRHVIKIQRKLARAGLPRIHPKNDPRVFGFLDECCNHTCHPRSWHKHAAKRGMKLGECIGVPTTFK